MPKDNNTLQHLQQQVDLLIKDFGGYWPPLSMLACVIEEVGEISRELNALEGFKPKKQDITISIHDKLAEELSDTLFSLICIANYYQINLSRSFQQILKKYQERDQKRFSSDFKSSPSS
ncbi:MAG: nucleotide pyrophosphohydrolase [Candidatus Lokiarchaeota archaeon]|nr:nucleotide pyrophosphohydrolase [Candidatus Harpocratesius repetitus]